MKAMDEKGGFEAFYKEVIRIGENVTNVISLPCVRGVTKDREENLTYQVEAENKDLTAHKGDYICLDKWGYYHVVKRGDERKQSRINKDIIDIAGVPAREMSKGEYFKGQLFSSESVQDRLEKEGDFEKQYPKDDNFYGYVEDHILFSATKEEFEDYVMKYFD